MPEVVLIRPGCTDFDEQQRVQGSLDLPLNSKGREQVDDLVNQLADANLDVIYTSPSEPARSTAQAIGQSLGVPVKEKEGFRNLDQGLWEGLKLDDIRRQYPKVFKQWQDSPETICPPEGESISDAMDRLRETLQKPLKRKANFGIVVSEPLASLVGCVVLGDHVESAPAFCGCGEFPELQWLNIDSVSQNT
ncbi:MAG: histidine phosphatase family protein [Planctomycetaceae bacterium]